MFGVMSIAYNEIEIWDIMMTITTTFHYCHRIPCDLEIWNIVGHLFQLLLQNHDNRAIMVKF
jgi:hypothetical protein